MDPPPAPIPPQIHLLGDYKISHYCVFTARQGAWFEEEGIRLQLGLIYHLHHPLYNMNALVCRCQAKSRILMPRPLWLPKPGSREHVPGSEVRAEGEKRGEGKTRAASHLGLCKAEEPANHHIWRGHQRLLFCLPEYKRDLCLLQHGLLALGSPPPRARLLLPTMSGTC